MAAKKKPAEPVAEEPAPEPESPEEEVQQDPPQETPAEDPPPLDDPVTVQVSVESASPDLSPTESGYNRLGQWVGRKVTRRGG